MLGNGNLIVKINYLVDVLGKIRFLNKSMPGQQMHKLIQNDVMKAVLRKWCYGRQIWKKIS